MDGVRGSGPTRRPRPTPPPEPGKASPSDDAPPKGAPDAARVDSLRDRLATLGLPGGRVKKPVDFPSVPTTVPDAEAAALDPDARRQVARIVERGRAGETGIARLGAPDDPVTLTAAKLVARDLGRSLVRVDTGALQETFIGETEKNLSRILEQAQATGAVLLFDEADALFGKRSGVEDSHDRHANQETSLLLSRLEAYDGIALLASNSGDGDP